MLDEVGWFKFNKKKPYVNQTVIIFRQGYDKDKHYYSQILIAVYAENEYDRRYRAFVEPVAFEAREFNVWQYTNVTNWMPLPEPPKRINND